VGEIEHIESDLPPLAAATPGIAALIEVLDRDGQARQARRVRAWPLRVGRALDNDLVLGDPHVAPHHFTIAPSERGQLELTVGDTGNGVHLGGRRLAAGARVALLPDGEALALSAGRTRLRLRLAGHTLAGERPLAAAVPLARRAAPIVAVAAVLLLGLLFRTWLDTDPKLLTRAIGSVLVTSVLGAALWCGVWALLSKTFTHQARFGWHLRVFLLASIALLVAGPLLALLAFAFSWPWVTDFAFIATIAIGATALYYHLLAVEPGRRRLLRWLAGAGAAAGVALSLWLNVQQTDQWGDELYMNHLFPPAWRLAKPVAIDPFIDGLAALKPGLDAKAREPGDDSDGPGDSDDE
jgi:pSer/pThr/pTyr-binding forkhead associated (FHA) protein